jgi:hypothetical protein
VGFVSDIARVLLTAAILSAIALAAYVWKLTRPDVEGAERLIGQLRLAQWAALVLAATGGVSIGLVVVNAVSPFGPIEVTIGAACVVLAAFVLSRDPREALFLCVVGFVAHALVDVAHRPGGLTPIAPAWYFAGCAIYDVFFAAICYWARRT